ncbi:hypothetical protein PHMEG_00016161 [Phytophthora megakarya]|uniref:Uncharacterized protein n=1 Tax=Phytophthora megakarya TaxID=4795 RepID=A0A225W218_9STRA|nr:hypothetical protein PHMEG_00016161 [Phytophthora megakarya]
MLESVTTYVIGKSISDVMDAELTQLIRSRCAKVDDGYIPDLRALFREALSMNMKIDDAEARFLTYFQEFDLIVQENQLQGRERDPGFQSKPTATTGPRNGCLSCKGPHWVKDCPKLTGTQRKKVLDRLQEKKNKEKDGAKARSVHVGQEEVGPDQMRVRLNGVLTAILIPDSRSDWTIIPSSIVGELRELQSSLEVGRLASPVVADLADGTKVECLTSVVVDLQLVTSAGTVNMSAVECLVMPTRRDEVLLGDSTLRSLGVNVNEQLIRLTQAPSLEEEMEEFATIEYGGSNHRAIDDTLDSMIIGTVKESFDDNELDDLRELLVEFRYTWRDKLGSDPPAMVAPLRITLCKGVEPYRCQARKYSPMQRRFLQDYTKELVEFGFVRYEVHGPRLKFYSDSSLNITEEITELVSNQGLLLGAREIKAHHFNAAVDR